jgi:hypothetical protein
VVEIVGRLRLSFWVAVAGVIVLYVFFVTLARVSPAQVATVSIVVGGLTTVFVVRNLLIARELADRGGDPRLRRSLNRIRERRGF